MREHGGALPARHVLGTYEVFEELGRGGMGIVYRALDLSLDRVVAIKVLRDDLRTQPQIVARFGREARAAASLDHPNIVQIYAVGSEDRVPYIAMEYVNGTPLCAVTQCAKQVPWMTALDITAQIASALACAHRAHIIHRDIKPSNVLVTSAGKAYITDFGIAKILTIDDGLTIDGSRLGTPHYMSPERCANGELTPMSDLYSLGVVLFQMVTGHLPHEGVTSVSLINQIIHEPPTRARSFAASIPEDVERLIAWMLERNPQHRPQSGDVVCEAIERIRAGKPLEVNASSMREAIADFRESMNELKTPTTGVRSASRQAHSRKGLFARLVSRKMLWALAGIVMATGLGAFAFHQVSAGGAQSDSSTIAVQAWTNSQPLCTFTEETPGTTLVRLHLPEYRIAGFGWTGKPVAAAVFLNSTSDSPRMGRRVVCGLEPLVRRASIGSPPLPFADRTSPQYDAPACSPSTDPASRLTGRFLVRVLAADRTAPHFVSCSILANHEESAPIAWLPADAGLADVTGLVIHPNGQAAVAVVNSVQGSRVVFLDLSETGVLRLKYALEPSGSLVRDLQYTPDGSKVYYVRGAEKGGSICVATEDANGVAERVIVDCGARLNEGAVRFDGQYLVSTENGPDGAPHLVVRNSESGQSIADLGEGRAGTWQPAHNTVIGVRPDRKGVPQLSLEVLDGSGKQLQLTHFENGVEPFCSVSPDGHWALSSTGGPEPTAVLIDLSRVSL
ncbi:MAG: serine/threonine protein kinase [Candidatus Hydrogenedentes bacterium]|nr:serine/threonine protein kinase [Candidatus Hydrogenedentota bacterium]